MYIKRFNRWNKIKKKTNLEKDQFDIWQREIRWVITGVNIGSEIDGKSNSFTIPALILKFINSKVVLIAPISSKPKKMKGVYLLKWRNKTFSIYLNQIRIISTKRILSRIGKVTKKQFLQIKKEFLDFYS